MRSSSAITMLASSTSLVHRLERAVERLDDQVEAAERLLLELRELLLEVGACRVGHAVSPTLPVTYASVRESDGFVKIFSVSSNSTTRPERCSSSSSSTVKNAVLSDTRAACCMLCVTITIE